MGRSNYRPVPGYCGTRTVVATKEKDGGPPAVLQRILLLLDAGADDVRRHGDLGRLRKTSAAGGRDVCAPSGRLSRTGIGIRSVLDHLGTGGSERWPPPPPPPCPPATGPPPQPTAGG